MALRRSNDLSLYRVYSGMEDLAMIEAFCILYVISLILVVVTMIRFPPMHRRREPVEWLIGIMLCWLIWPFAVVDLICHKR